MSDEKTPPDVEVSMPIPAGLQVSGDRPYRILVLDDYAGSESGSVAGPLQDGVVNVSADNLDQVIAHACPSVNYTISDPLAPGSSMVEVSLRFDSLRAFHPSELANQLPATQSMMQIREKLVQRMHGKLSESQLAEAVDKAAGSDSSHAWLRDALKRTTPPPSTAPDVVDELLSQIDLGEEERSEPSAPAPQTPLGALVSAAAGGEGTRLPAQEASAIRRALAELDRRVGVWLTTVLHSPEVQQLEASWRSLSFLVSHTDFRKGVRLSILHASKPKLVDRFTALVIDPVFDQGAEAPDVVVVGAPFGNSATDIETLDGLTQHAASLPAIVIAGIAPAFFGVKYAWQVSTLPTFSNLFDRYEFAKWRSLRAKPYALSLAVVFGRCLLRAPYDPSDDAKDLEFAYREQRLLEKDFLWTSGAIAAACNVSQSVGETGWPTAVAGQLNGRVEAFATAKGGKKADKIFGPTDAHVPDPKVHELAAVGINVMAELGNLHDAVLCNGLTAARPVRMNADAFLEVSLPYQLFAARLGAMMFALKQHLSGLSPDQVVRFVEQHIRGWLAFEGKLSEKQLSVETRPVEGDPKTLELAVAVTPPQTILPGAIPIALGYRLA